jgi:BirA family transcriptional regulator, biotin operon repressor / biotin---[acetyl-CoA-carboxylase] ligase
MSLRFQLISLLADGRFHSGQTLSARLGISRSGIWKHAKTLAALGLEVQALPGRGYRLAEPLELLDPRAVLRALDERSRQLLSAMEVLPSVDSTNDYLNGKAREGAPSGQACLAEHQRSGRGRHGRRWVSPFGGNVYLSLLWRFAFPPHALAGLSLAAGVAVARALRNAGVCGIGLKWPNDVLGHGRKLAGVLIDIAGESSGHCHAVVGVGLNVQMGAVPGAAIDQPWTDVRSVLGKPVSRNLLAGLLLHHLLLAMEEFRQGALRSFLAEWTSLDLISGRHVALRRGNETVSGLAQGVSPAGELIIASGGVLRTYACGEVSASSPA